MKIGLNIQDGDRVRHKHNKRKEGVVLETTGMTAKVKFDSGEIITLPKYRLVRVSLLRILIREQVSKISTFLNKANELISR